MSISPTRRLPLLLLTSLVFSGCMALPFLIPPLVEFGANLLRTAFNNYGNNHEQNMENLLAALQQRINPANPLNSQFNPQVNPMMPQGIIANPLEQSSGYPHSGYPNQEYQTAQGYPPSQPYPSPDYSQQAYDPYQNQQPLYGGNTPYPNNQYPNQGQPGNPYSANPVYPDQQASVPGYSTGPQDPYAQQSQQPYPLPHNQNGSPYQQNPYPNQQNPYPNQAPYPNHSPYPGQSQTYAQNSYSLDQQTANYPGSGDTGMASSPMYPNQPEESLGYPDTQVAPAQSAIAPISLDVLLVKKHIVNGVQSYLPIKDGDILRDGRGNPQAGDKFRVMFRTNTDGYVYVIAVDGSAWAQGLFPPASTPFANPVKAGEQYILPEGANWFSLDQYQGIETLFFVASHARRQDVEQILTTITGRERSPLEKPQAVSEPAIVPNGFAGARPSSLPFALQTFSNQQQELLPTTYFVTTAGEDLRVTRWFRHQ